MSKRSGRSAGGEHTARGEKGEKGRRGKGRAAFIRAILNRKRPHYIVNVISPYPAASFVKSSRILPSRSEECGIRVFPIKRTFALGDNDSTTRSRSFSRRISLAFTTSARKTLRICPEEIHCAWSIYRRENVEGEYGEFLTGLSSPSLRFPSLMRPSSDDQRR